MQAHSERHIHGGALEFWQELFEEVSGNMTNHSDWRSESLDLALEDLRLSVLARGTDVVVVIGAGASVESGVPLADVVCERIQGALPMFSRQFQNKGGRPTLEGFLEFVRWKLRFNFNPTASVGRLIADSGIPTAESVPAVPSLLHLLVARLAASGVASIIVSLNFDEILERCLKAELGSPGDVEELGSSDDSRWISLSEVHHFEKIGQIIDRPASSSTFQTALIKPHGTISRRRLVAAAADVREFHPVPKAMLLQALGSEDVHFLFLGCSLRDSDFLDLFYTVEEVKARITVLGTSSLDEWIRKGREALSHKHPFDCPALVNTSIVYVQCGREGTDPCLNGTAELATSEELPTGSLPTNRRLRTATQLSPGQVLLKVMVDASDATGKLQERNAPAVSDIRIHDWVRCHLVGTRQGPESFFATELLIGAAHENGVFEKDRIIKSRGHLALLRGSPFESLLEGLFRRFVETRVYITVEPARRFALSKIKKPVCLRSILELVGPLRNWDQEKHSARLVELLIDLAENKARRSTWRTGDPVDLVGIERGTSMVLDTTDELLVISEYGTWMRRERLNRGFPEAVERATKYGRRVDVILATPPPTGSQGYLEWLVSALWLNRVSGLRLWVLDVDQHDHHMNLGQQIAIDFKRQGTGTELVDSAIRFGHEDRQRLSEEFDKRLKKAETFGEWQLRCGLALAWGDVGIRYVVKKPVEEVIVDYHKAFNRAVTNEDKEAASLNWQRENERRRAQGMPQLEAKRLFRPLDAMIDDHQLHIRAGVTSYFDNFALQKPTDEWCSDSIVGAGLSVVPVCTDGVVLVGKRSAVVADGVGKYHVAGGHAHPRDDFKATTLEEAACQELEEEMHIRGNDVERWLFLGLILNHSTSKPEFVIQADLKQPSKPYIERWKEDVANGSKAGREPEEFTEVTTLNSLLGQPPGDPISLRSLFDERHRFVVACQGALLTYGVWHPETKIEEIEQQLS